MRASPAVAWCRLGTPVDAPRPRLILALIAVLASSPGVAAERPAAVIAALRGPFSYVAGPIPRGLDVRATLASARIELHPDHVVVEQTVTLQNRGKTAAFWVGVDQPRRWASAENRNDSWVASRILACAAWVDGAPIPEERIVLSDRALDDDGGYSLGLRVELTPGEHVVTLAFVAQSVADMVTAGVARPGGGSSSVVVALEGLATGFAAEEDNAVGRRVVVSTGAGVGLDGVVARAWTDGAKAADDRVYWTDPVRLVLEVRSDDGPRASTADELVRTARIAIDRPPRGHVTVPAAARPLERPEDPLHPSSDDAMRARRALLVPAAGLFVVVLVMYLFRRRKERRR